MESQKSSGNKLYRSEKGKVIAGVCHGLAEHFNIDPVLVRLIFVLLSLVDGLGIIVYAVLWLILPRVIRVPPPEPEEMELSGAEGTFAGEAGKGTGQAAERGQADAGELIIVDGRSPFFVYLVLGLLSILTGVWILLQVFLAQLEVFFPNIALVRLLWPVVLVVAGLIIIVAGATRK